MTLTVDSGLGEGSDIDALVEAALQEGDSGGVAVQTLLEAA
jgi:hypothetical protein